MQKKGFFAALFDMSFSSFITVRIVQLLYWLSLIGIGLTILILVIALVSRSVGAGVLGLILAPFIFIIWAIFVRVYLETIIVLFKIADNKGEMAAAGGQPHGGQPAAKQEA